ncbi:unnamed protein product, partial [Effrenium voratum]
AGCGALESAQLLLDQKADVNQRCQPAGRFRTLELSCRAVGLCRGAPGIFVNIFSNISTTPLGSCAMTDQKDLATFLLLARADPEIPNNRGQRAADLVVSRQMRELLQEPLSSLEARLDPIHLPDELVAEYL